MLESGQRGPRLATRPPPSPRPAAQPPPDVANRRLTGRPSVHDARGPTPSDDVPSDATSAVHHDAGPHEGAGPHAGRSVGVLGAGHFTNDIYASVLPAMLPVVLPALGLTVGSGGILVAAYQIVSAILQPLIGHVA